MSDDGPGERDDEPVAWPDPDAVGKEYPDEPQSPGYDTDFDKDADPHDPTIGEGVSQRSLRHLGYKLTHAEDVEDLVGTIQRYGWAVPIAALLFHSVFRGAFEFLTEPFAMSQRYVFSGWKLALVINFIYGLFLVGFAWFLYFGVIGSFAGFFSEKTKMETTVFKVGGYLMVLFVPVLVVSSILAVTIAPPDAAVAGVDPAFELAETHQQVSSTPQMRLINALFAAGWVVVGFLMIPVISQLYDVSTKVSVLTVLPVTLIAVVGTQFF